jgi:myo-inositol-1(or 4)-monophosphatase
MNQDAIDREILRYCRQVVLKAMEMGRTSMRGSGRLSMRTVVDNKRTLKAGQNRSKAIDIGIEDLMLGALGKKFARIPALRSYAVFSEESGITTYPPDASERDVRWVVFLDPIDGTEFVETLQGGWSLLAVYDRDRGEFVAAVAGDFFLDRLYWASRGGDAEAIDFLTHSWFRLDGGPEPKRQLAGARVNLLTSKVSRFRAVARQERLLEAIEQQDGRINLAWGSNLIIQVAAGYADVGVEFAKGFATYDILPGLFVAERAGLTILDLRGNPVSSRLDIDAIFDAYRRDSQNPQRLRFVAAKDPQLARDVVELLDPDPESDGAVSPGTTREA